jgi:hypothetical protein
MHMITNILLSSLLLAEVVKIGILVGLDNNLFAIRKHVFKTMLNTNILANVF